MGFHSRCGGVSEHAISRVQQQFKSPLDDGEIRKILRGEKNTAKIKHGNLLLAQKATKKLRVDIPPNKKLVAVICGGVIATVLSIDSNMESIIR